MKQKIQIALVLAMLVAGIRLALIFYERHEASIVPEKKEAPPLNPDYYVTPKKLYPYDLKSAKKLTKQPDFMNSEKPILVSVSKEFPIRAADGPRPLRAVGRRVVAGNTPVRSRANPLRTGAARKSF